MSDINLLCIAGGGHFRSVASMISRLERVNIRAILDPLKIENLPNDVLHFKNTKEVLDYYEMKSVSNWSFLVCLGAVRNVQARKRLFDELNRDGFAAASPLIAKSGIVDSTACLGLGTVAMERCYVGPNCQIEENVIVNSGSIIEHDSFIGSHSHVSTGVIINGGVSIGSGSFIGSGSIIFEGVSLAANSVIRAGSIIRSKPTTFVD